MRPRIRMRYPDFVWLAHRVCSLLSWDATAAVRVSSSTSQHDGTAEPAARPVARRHRTANGHGRSADVSRRQHAQRAEYAGDRTLTTANVNSYNILAR